MAAPKGNKYAIGNHGGCPAHYEMPDQLAAEVLNYFSHCEGEFHEEELITINKKTGEEEKTKIKVWDRYPEKLTITGLALWLGFASRSSFNDYEQRGKEFSYIIRRAKLVVENGYEMRLQTDIPGAAAGAMFALKNMGWKDKYEVDNNNMNHNSEPLRADQMKDIAKALDDEC